MPRPVPQKDKDFSSLLIKELRKSKSLTQQEMADVLSISDKRISQLENAHSQITIGKFIDWCEALKADPSKIFEKAYKQQQNT